MPSEHAALPGPTPPDGMDLRTDPRFRCMAGAICRWRPAGECNAVLVNMSAGGARLMVRMLEEPPHLAGVVLRGRSGAVLELRAREVYAQRQEGVWVMGCAFGRKLSEAELRDVLPESGGEGASC
jgi:hypothetical protein